MKLHELINHTKKTTSQLRRSNQPEHDDDDYDGRLGSGSFSVVYPDEDPHMVKKRGRNVGNVGGDDNPLPDRFVEYAAWIVDNKLWEESVHFPRIYVTEYDEHNDIYDFTLERLHTEEKLSVDVLVGLFKRYANKKAIDIYMSSEVSTSYDAHYNITRIVNRALHGYDYIKDPELLKAIKMVQREMENHTDRWEYDIHDDNLMYRITNVGPQLVFNDIIMAV